MLSSTLPDEAFQPWYRVGDEVPQKIMLSEDAPVTESFRREFDDYLLDRFGYAQEHES